MSETVERQSLALRRHRWFATAMLLAAAGLFLVARLLLPPSFWSELLRAGAEAALVGGLADWFAVTALFRRPLGLPIPHTAVIPANKDRIGAGLGRFVERHFLEPDLVTAKLRSLAPARRLAQALGDERKARALAAQLGQLLPYLMRSAGDRELRQFLGQALQRQIASLDLAALGGRVLDALYRSDRHHLLLDRLLLAARDWLQLNQEEAFRLVEEKSRWWIPRRVDRRIAEALLRGIVELLGDLLQRDHPLRQRFDASIADYIESLRQDPARRRQVERALRRLLAEPETAAYLDRLWRGLRDHLESDLALPDSLVQGALAQSLGSLGRALQADPAMQRRIEQRIEAVTLRVLLPWRAEIGGFIAEVVKGWDAGTVVERIELAVGRDLQYIRINGTLVGALVGCLIFLISRFVLP